MQLIPLGLTLPTALSYIPVATGSEALHQAAMGVDRMAMQI
jgi:hypothetical protein